AVNDVIRRTGTQLMRARVLACPVIWTDDTRSRYLVPGRDAAPRGHFWVTVGDAGGTRPANDVVPAGRCQHERPAGLADRRAVIAPIRLRIAQLSADNPAASRRARSHRSGSHPDR